MERELLRRAYDKLKAREFCGSVGIVVSTVSEDIDNASNEPFEVRERVATCADCKGHAFHNSGCDTEALLVEIEKELAKVSEVIVTPGADPSGVLVCPECDVPMDKVCISPEEWECPSCRRKI